MGNLAKASWMALAIALTASSAASAQAVDPNACTPQERASELGQQSGRTNGVICPPDVDSKMAAPTPNAGNMPVIPAPGSPGGDPSVQPK
jgi:hypothetical protein